MGEIGAFVSGLPIDVAWGGLVMVMILAIFNGWVIPRKTFEDFKQNHSTQLSNLIKERDDWREAYMAEAEGSAEKSRQISRLLDGAQATQSLVEALRLITVRPSKESYLEGDTS